MIRIDEYNQRKTAVSILVYEDPAHNLQLKLFLGQ